MPGAVFTSFVKNEDANDIADNPMRTNTVKILIPDGLDKMKQIDEAVDDLYTAATDDDPDRMVYVTGQTAKEIYQKRQEMGDEAFRKYFAKLLLAE